MWLPCRRSLGRPCVSPLDGLKERMKPTSCPPANQAELNKTAQPFAKITKSVSCDYRLTPTAVRLLSWLLAQAMGNPFAWASVAQLASELGCSERTIQNAIALLRSLRYFQIVQSSELKVGRVFQFRTVTPQAAQDAIVRLGLNPDQIETVNPIEPLILPSPPTQGRPPRPQAQVQKIAPRGAEICTQIVRKNEQEIERSEKEAGKVSNSLGTNDFRSRAEQPKTPLSAEQRAAIEAVAAQIERLHRRSPEPEQSQAAAAMATALRDVKNLPAYRAKVRGILDHLWPASVVAGAIRDVLSVQAAGKPVLRPGAYFERCFQGRLNGKAQVDQERAAHIRAAQEGPTPPPQVQVTQEQAHATIIAPRAAQEPPRPAVKLMAALESVRREIVIHRSSKFASSLRLIRAALQSDDAAAQELAREYLESIGELGPPATVANLET